MSARRWAFLDWPQPIPVAHRGGAAEQPENTMPAFAAAVAMGYRYVETDVHATADGVLLAFHDHSLDRVTDMKGDVGALPYSTVRSARVGGEPIPLLEDVLGTWPELRVHVDAKHGAAVAPLVAAVERTGAHDRVCLGAFSDRRVSAIRKLSGGRICTWMGRREILALRAASIGLPAPRSPAGCTQVPVRQGRLPLVDRRLVAAAHRRGVAVHVWTINDDAEMERLLDLGVDGLLSDRPSVLKEVFVRRGLWI
ncbi:MAG TPA: glycerophosphodiester phosphodiesterase family protein [Acidimicrobiales bacterium]|jgi:glycerophosphoryl diester phosphodiesterase|nr:glycerophosphodiester phosphodiesterase family protein [Acidimicrobiales bacterium]